MKIVFVPSISSFLLILWSENTDDQRIFKNESRILLNLWSEKSDDHINFDKIWVQCLGELTAAFCYVILQFIKKIWNVLGFRYTIPLYIWKAICTTPPFSSNNTHKYQLDVNFVMVPESTWNIRNWMCEEIFTVFPRFCNHFWIFEIKSELWKHLSYRGLPYFFEVDSQTFRNDYKISRSQPQNSTSIVLWPQWPQKRPFLTFQK